MEDMYSTIAVIVGVLTFIGSWIYCIASYGFLLGVGLGWLPSIIVAYIAAIIWPVIAVLVLVAIVLFN